MKTNFNLASTVYRHSLITPDALALTCQGRTLTYGELAERAARTGACLASRATPTTHGAQPPRVGILASRGIDACVATLGACWSGATDKHGDRHDFADDESLFLSGRLGSFSMINLVVYLETELSVDFSALDFDVNLVDSVNDIEALVDSIAPR